jgi:DNA-binding transcriptional LysR family regulator
MNDLETREPRYSIAVAEELHSGRAAEHLLIAQPALLKVTRRLEDRLGVDPRIRSSRGASLTPAGSALLVHGRYALDAVAAAARSARDTGGPTQRPRLVVESGGASARWKRQAAASSGPQIEDLAQLIHLVRLELVVAPLALSLIAPVPEGVTCEPIFDAPTNDPVLARPPARKSNALRSFVHAALYAVDTKQVPTSKIKKKDRS